MSKKKKTYESSISRVLSAYPPKKEFRLLAIYLGLGSPLGSIGLPPSIGRATLQALVYATFPPTMRTAAIYHYRLGGLLPHLFTLTTSREKWRLFSVTLIYLAIASSWEVWRSLWPRLSSRVATTPAACFRAHTLLFCFTLSLLPK